MVKILIPTTHDRLPRIADTLRSVVENAGMEVVVILSYKMGGGAGGALRGLVETLNDDDIALYQDDDCLGNPNYVVNLYNAFKAAFPDGDGIACGRHQDNDQTHLATMPMSSGKWFKKWVFGGYRSYYMDNELHDVGMAQGKFIYAYDSTVRHMHFSWAPELKDDTYIRAGNNDAHDRDLYHARKAASDDYKNPDAIEWGTGEEANKRN